MSEGISENENERDESMVVHNSVSTNYKNRDDTQTNKDIASQHCTKQSDQSENNDSSASIYSDIQTSPDTLPSTNRSIEDVDLFKSFDFSPDKISALQ